MKSSIATDYRQALRSNYNAAQDNPFNLPTGFYYTVTKSSKVLSFYCPACKLNVVGATDTVKHCGRTTIFPTGLFAWLRTMRLKSVNFQRRWY